MSENQENKEENSVEKEWKEIKAREKTIVLKNNVTADQIPIHVSEQDATKLKELFEQQNQAHNQLEKENAELRKERSSEIEDQIGKTETTAPLNENQVTGKTNEDIIRENREIQKILAEHQDIYGADLNVDWWEFTSEEKLKEALDDAVSGKYGKERQTEAIEITKQIRNRTSRQLKQQNLEMELESKPMNRWQFNGVGKPATEIPKEKRVKPKFIPVERD